MEEPQPRAGAASVLSSSCTSAPAGTPTLGCSGATLLRHCPPVPPGHRLLGEWAAAEFCGIRWKLPSLTQCSHTSVVHGFAHTHPCYMPVGLSHARTPGHLETPAQGCHKRTHSIHPMQRNRMHRCSHLFSAFTDAHLGLRPRLDL